MYFLEQSALRVPVRSLPPAHEPKSERIPPAPWALDHVPALDGVRGIAILIVLVHNASFIVETPEGWALKVEKAMAAGGWAGVELFFVLSGFLITGVLLSTRHNGHFFRNFYIRRTLRIFPLY